MEDILITVVAKAAEYTVDPIISWASNIWNPQSIVQETCNQLQECRTQVSDRCNSARLNGEEIIDDVNKWLNNAETVLTGVEQWLQESVSHERNRSSRFTRFYTSEWVWERRQRSIARQMKVNLSKMLEEGKRISTSNTVSRLARARGIQLLPSTGCIDNESLYLAFDNIMLALRTKCQSLIGVYGMGGIGKTTLVKKVIAAAEDLYDLVVVVVVSQVPNIQKMQAELGEQMCLKSDRETSIGRAAQIRNRMKKEEKILVVLDDVWEKIDLLTIGIPYGDHEGCHVLLTTRNKNVCSAMGCEELIEMKLLNENDSRNLFETYAAPSPELTEVAKDITRECKNLPLALVVVAKALRDKSKDQWEYALKKLESSRLHEIEGTELVYQNIELSYDFLRVETHRKSFLMCSLYPEDYEISVEMLTKYALGYGLFDDDTMIEYVTAEKQVKIIIDKLVERGLLIKEHERFKMHDVVRDAAIWITSKGEEVFLVPIPSQNKWIRDPKLVKAKAISLLACPENQHLPNPTDCPGLKMLLLAQRTYLKNVGPTCFDGMTSLQVLDMTSIAYHLLELELPSSLQFLTNLRTLYLRRWILKGDISMIGSLTKLEILSFAGSVFDKLPDELAELSELKILDLSSSTIHAGSVDLPGNGSIEEIYRQKRQITDLIYDKA